MAMSGGVDSTTAAFLLKKQGYEVIGITAQMFGDEGVQVLEKAKITADSLGIEHHAIDLTGTFRNEVINQFCSEYLSGRTPSPCIRCNRFIKFGALLEYATDLGCEKLATGHYAMIKEQNGRHFISSGADKKKDQSYFLFFLEQDQLKRILFPLGEMTKEEIRKVAMENYLPSASASESQEICFIPDNDYKTFISKNTKLSPPEHGDIVGTDGTFFKKHDGIYRYTIGQRRGLGISYSEPLYVVDIVPDQNRVIVGTKEHLNRKGLIAEEIILQKAENLNGIRVYTKIRSTHSAKPSIVEVMDGNRVRVIFDEPITQVSPGQAAVFYDGDMDVLGGGWIKESIPFQGSTIER